MCYRLLFQIPFAQRLNKAQHADKQKHRPGNGKIFRYIHTFHPVSDYFLKNEKRFFS